MKSLLVFDPKDMNSAVPGGVQLCSQEFLKIIKAASESLDYFEVSISRRLSWRIRRQLNLGSYLLYHPNEARSAALEKIGKNRPTHVFLNRPELLRLAPLFREILPEAKIILMSFGNQSGDDLYELAGQGGRRIKGFSRLAARWQLGQDLGIESWFRHRYLDAVCAMSKEEEIIERWLGAKTTVVLPRLIYPDLIDRFPQNKRVGFVGTLNHTPNTVALEKICEEIDKCSEKVELRVVGRPGPFGHALARRYEFVTYLGALDESELKAEVSSWSLFLNPIFWLSCGASMKLGKAISWGIPFLTTRSGARGYELVDANFLTTQDDPCEFVERLFEIIGKDSNCRKATDIVKHNQTHSPTLEDLSARLTAALHKENYSLSCDAELKNPTLVLQQ